MAPKKRRLVVAEAPLHGFRPPAHASTFFFLASDGTYRSIPVENVVVETADRDKTLYPADSAFKNLFRVDCNLLPSPPDLDAHLLLEHFYSPSPAAADARQPARDAVCGDRIFEPADVVGKAIGHVALHADFAAPKGCVALSRFVLGLPRNDLGYAVVHWEDECTHSAEFEEGRELLRSVCRRFYLVYTMPVQETLTDEGLARTHPSGLKALERPVAFFFASLASDKRASAQRGPVGGHLDSSHAFPVPEKLLDDLQMVLMPNFNLCNEFPGLARARALATNEGSQNTGFFGQQWPIAWVHHFDEHSPGGTIDQTTLGPLLIPLYPGSCMDRQGSPWIDPRGEDANNSSVLPTVVEVFKAAGVALPRSGVSVVDDSEPPKKDLSAEVKRLRAELEQLKKTNRQLQMLVDKHAKTQTAAAETLL